jgi:hypothetical protein
VISGLKGPKRIKESVSECRRVLWLLSLSAFDRDDEACSMHKSMMKRGKSKCKEKGKYRVRSRRRLFV